MASLALLYSLLLLLFVESSVQVETKICNPDAFRVMGTNMNTLPFCDTKLPYTVRAKDLVDRMNLQEKVAQLGNQAIGVKHLNLPGYQWWSEALHGVSDLGPGTHFDNNVPAATNFPTVILSSASFNETLWKTIGQAVSDEARAMHNLGLAGLTFWSPTINVVRDPRWGRITETPGEDPFVVGRYAANYVRGLQDVPGFEKTKDLNTRPLKVAACCKHYAAYDIDNWKGIDRFHFDAKVTERDMAETFVYPFEMCVREGDVASVMCSYNRVNGVPTCADPRLLNHTIREQWNLHGYIVADCDSIQVMVEGHKYLNDTPAEAVAQTLNAGLDLDCGRYYPDHATAAVREGKVTEEKIDRSLMNIYIVLMRLGWFDGNPGHFSGLGKNDICSPPHLELAAEAARESIVLLKNDKDILPLNFNGKRPKFAVVGPHGNATVAMLGSYTIRSGRACRYWTPQGALREYGDVVYAPGCLGVKCPTNNNFGQAIQATVGVDATFVFAGLDSSIENEGLDRVDLNFPGFQQSLITQIANASTSPVILVILSAGGIDISFAKDNPKISAILWAGYPGAEGGRAIADVIFGKSNPGGRLPITWYPADYVNKVPMTSMQLRPDPKAGYPGRTYKFYNGSTIYPFGYGLSYTTFTYSIKSAPKLVTFNLGKLQKCKKITMLDGSQPNCPAISVRDSSCREVVKVAVEVRNTGKRDGATPVLLYSVPPSDVADAPMKRLIGFNRVFLRAGQAQVVKFRLNACKSFSIVGVDAYELLPSGEHSIIAGDGTNPASAQISFRFQ